MKRYSVARFDIGIALAQPVNEIQHLAVAPHPDGEAGEGCPFGWGIFSMPDIMVDTRSVWPIALNSDKSETLALDELARDTLAHTIEFRGAMRRFSEENDTRIADAIEQRFEVSRGYRFKLFARCRDSLCQRSLGGLDCRTRRRRDVMTIFRGPAFFPYQRDEADISDIFRFVFVPRYADDAHQFLIPPIAPYRNNQSASDFKLRLQRFRYLGPACRDHNRIIGRLIRPAAGSVSM